MLVWRLTRHSRTLYGDVTGLSGGAVRLCRMSHAARGGSVAGERGHVARGLDTCHGMTPWCDMALCRGRLTAGRKVYGGGTWRLAAGAIGGYCALSQNGGLPCLTSTLAQPHRQMLASIVVVPFFWWSRRSRWVQPSCLRSWGWVAAWRCLTCPQAVELGGAQPVPAVRQVAALQLALPIGWGYTRGVRNQT